MQKAFELRPELIPPRGSEIVGTHDDGRIIYEIKNYMDPRAIKKEPILDGDGKPMYKKNPTTAEPMYPLFKAVAVYRDIRFVLERSIRGHVRIQEHFEASPEEKAAIQASQDREVFGKDLAGEAVARGISAADLLDRLSGGMIPARKEDLVPEGAAYPYERGAGWWILSDGTKFRGKKVAAERMEEALQDDVMESPGEREAEILAGVEITVPEGEGAVSEGAKSDSDSYRMPDEPGE
jgi:hypothetical protein